MPVEALGIESIGVRATGEASGCPANEDGLRLRDGRVLPTYDWIAEPKTAVHHIRRSDDRPRRDSFGNRFETDR